MWMPKIGVPQNGWFIMEIPIKMDDLGVPLFLETPMSRVSSLGPFGGTHLVGNTATADNDLDLDVVASHSQFAIVWEP